MIANLFDLNLIKVLALFLISPGSRYTRKEIKEKTEMNNVPLDKSLSKMLRLEMISREKGIFMLNPHSNLINVIEEIKKEYKEFGLPLKIYQILVEISDKVSEIKYVKSAYLFGSYSKLIYHENSDIDIAVFFDNRVKNKRNLERRIETFIKKISKKKKKRR